MEGNKNLFITIGVGVAGFVIGLFTGRALKKTPKCEKEAAEKKEK